MKKSQKRHRNIRRKPLGSQRKGQSFTPKEERAEGRVWSAVGLDGRPTAEALLDEGIDEVVLYLLWLSLDSARGDTIAQAILLACTSELDRRAATDDQHAITIQEKFLAAADQLAAQTENHVKLDVA